MWLWPPCPPLVPGIVHFGLRALLATLFSVVGALAAGFSKAETIWLVTLLGGVTYATSGWIFHLVSARFSSGPAGKLAAAKETRKIPEKPKDSVR